MSKTGKLGLNSWNGENCREMESKCRERRGNFKGKLKISSSETGREQRTN